jgi:hypothetical protein
VAACSTVHNEFPHGSNVRQGEIGHAQVAEIVAKSTFAQGRPRDHEQAHARGLLEVIVESAQRVNEDHAALREPLRLPVLFDDERSVPDQLQIDIVFVSRRVLARERGQVLPGQFALAESEFAGTAPRSDHGTRRAGLVQLALQSDGRHFVDPRITVDQAVIPFVLVSGVIHISSVQATRSLGKPDMGAFFVNTCRRDLFRLTRARN